MSFTPICSVALDSIQLECHASLDGAMGQKMLWHRRADHTMNRQDLIAYKAQIDRLYKAEMEACALKWQRKLEAVKVLLEDLPPEAIQPVPAAAKNGPTRTAAEVPEKSQTSDADNLSVMGMIREVLPQLQGKFTIKDVLSAINERHPGAVQIRDLSNPLWRLANKSAEIRMVEQGQGRRPSTYVRP